MCGGGGRGRGRYASLHLLHAHSTYVWACVCRAPALPLARTCSQHTAVDNTCSVVVSSRTLTTRLASASPVPTMRRSQPVRVRLKRGRLPSPFPSWPTSAPPSPPPPAPPPRPNPCLASVVVHAGVVCGACECSRAGLESCDELVNSPPPLFILSSAVQSSAVRAFYFPLSPCLRGPLAAMHFARLQWGSSGAVVVRGERTIRNRHPTTRDGSLKRRWRTQRAAARVRTSGRRTAWMRCYFMLPGSSGTG